MRGYEDVQLQIAYALVAEVDPGLALLQRQRHRGLDW